MNINQERRSCGFVLLLAVMLVMAGSAQAGEVRVGGYSLRANGQVAKDFQYSGACPVELKFGWGLIGTEPTTVTYTITRSEGGHESARTVHLPGNRTETVYVDWRLGAHNRKFADYHGWVDLHVHSPNHVSQKIEFTLHCR